MSMEDYLNIDPASPTNEKRIMSNCPDCDGDGEMLSDCCGVPGKSNGDSCTEDYGICPECHDHCTYSPCETCGGTGEVEMTEDEIQDMKDSDEDDPEIELCKKYCKN